MLSNLIYMLPNVGHLFQDENMGKKINQMLNWSLWFVIIMLDVHSF